MTTPSPGASGERHYDNRVHLPFDRLRAGNGAGDRVARTVDGVTTDYVLDPAAGLTQVLQETTAGQATSYLYGHDLLAQSDSGTWAYHVNDELGSVRQLVDPAGEVQRAQSYDPFGNLLSASGSAGSAYGYTGEQEDASTGLVFLRARYYQPETGRFVSKDPWPGNMWHPCSSEQHYPDLSPTGTRFPGYSHRTPPYSTTTSVEPGRREPRRRTDTGWSRLSSTFGAIAVAGLYLAGFP